MVWTIVLKNGDGFVVYGSSFNRNDEVRKALRGRSGVGENDIAGVIQGSHKVEPYPTAATPKLCEVYGDQVKSALAAPRIDSFIDPYDTPADEFEKSIDDDLAEITKVDGAPINDPRDW